MDTFVNHFIDRMYHIEIILRQQKESNKINKAKEIMEIYRCGKMRY